MGKLDFLNFFLSIVNHKTKTVSVMSAMLPAWALSKPILVLWKWFIKLWNVWQLNAIMKAKFNCDIPFWSYFYLELFFIALIISEICLRLKSNVQIYDEQ